MAAPLAAAAATAEHPGERVVRLMKELREALVHPDGWGGQFMAEVFPLGTPGSIALIDVEFRAEQQRQARSALAFVEFERRGLPLDRARHHAQELTLALREHHGHVGVESRWYGEDAFTVINANGALPVLRVRP